MKPRLSFLSQTVNDYDVTFLFTCFTTRQSEYECLVMYWMREVQNRHIFSILEMMWDTQDLAENIEQLAWNMTGFAWNVQGFAWSINREITVRNQAFVFTLPRGNCNIYRWCERATSPRRACVSGCALLTSRDWNECKLPRRFHEGVSTRAIFRCWLDA